MLAWFHTWFGAQGFMPHGHCYLWQPTLVALHVASDLSIGAAYVAISLLLYHLVRAIRLPFSAMALSFGVFIGACACTHLMEIWNLWHANYWVAGAVKLLTAVASVTTALWLVALLPKIMAVADAAQQGQRRRYELEEVNKVLHEQAHKLAESHQILAEQQKMLVQSAKMSALGEMAGGIAHEINSPLAIILLRAQQLQRAQARGTVDPQLLDKETQLIAKTAVRIGNIVKGLQAFAREGGKDPFEPARVGDILTDVLSLCKTRFHREGIVLNVEPFARELAVYCRPVQICQVVVNLLNNAYDAISTSEEKWVSLSVGAEGEAVELAVTDSGPAIADDVRARMMQPFFTTKEVGKGTGLGLSISQGIVEEHRGKLSVDAKSPNTRFVLRLPRAAGPQGAQA